MRIVIDANVLLSDFLLRSEKIRLLLDYVRRTETKIYIPEIVLREVEGHVLRNLQRQMATFTDTVSIVEACTATKFAVPAIPTPAELAKSYMDRIRRRYHLNQDRILRVRPEQLNELIDRATTRRRPFNDKGQEFRDALIWLSLLDMGSERERVSVSFISTNTRDFGSEAGELHPDLRREAEDRNLELRYFSSLDAFLKSHAEPIAFITSELIERLLDIAEIETQTIAQLNKREASMERLRNKFENEHSGATGNVELVTVSLSLADHYVYPGDHDNEYRVIAMLEGEGELWGEVYQWSQEREFSLNRRPFEYDFDHEWIFPSIEVEVELLLIGEELQEWSLISCNAT